MIRNHIFVISIMMFSSACAVGVQGPDKQGAGMIPGALTGAGAGAVTGFQLGAGAGPGALVGAGLGAVAGSITGIMQDEAEEGYRIIAERTKLAQERSHAQEILLEHYKESRLELHPSRDIYPADLFFEDDDVKISNEAIGLVGELVALNKNRAPWSRFEVTAYVTSKDKKSSYAKYLSRRRARALSDAFTHLGIEPRRIVSRGVVVAGPVLIDPADDPLRYNQAIELTPLDL